MNILKFLVSKAGKLPITLAQAAGITAVVGAAGFGAMSFLSTPADNNNVFIPPSAGQEQVVYVSQGGGGGRYEANGEIGSSFKAAPSRAIRLANQEQARQAQTRALEESAGRYSGQPGEEFNPQLPKAYQTSGADLGLGMGGNADKQLNSSLETFSSIQNQLSGVTAAVNNAQAQARTGQAKPGASVSGNPTGQNAAQLANSSRNWGQGGLTRAGGSSGTSNSFVVQNSGKNTRGQDPQAALAQAGNAVAQAQAAMNQMREGTRLQSRANFGNSDGLGVDKDATGQRARRFGRGKNELEFIRKQTAAIHANKTNAANEGGNPFLASAKISGGLTVSGDNVTTGQGSSSGDLRSTSGAQLRGIGAYLNAKEMDLDQQKLEKDQLLMDMAIMFATTVALMVLITFLVKAARHAGIYAWVFWAAAAVATAAGLAAIWFGLVPKVASYEQNYGSSGWTVAGYVLSGVFTAGLGAAWFMGLKAKSFMFAGIKSLAGPALGLFGGGWGVFKMLSDMDKYKTEVDQANSGVSQVKEQLQGTEIEGGSEK